MQRYPACKASGIEWLGEIPAHWEVVLLKRVLQTIKDGTHGTFERVAEGKLLLSAKNVFSDGIKISNDESLISESDHQEIVKNGFPCKGDMLLTIVGTIGRSFVYNIDYPLAFQRSVAFLRFKSFLNPHYYYYFSQTLYFIESLKSLAKTSAQSGVYMGDVVQVPVLKIPINEQRAIAAYLDHKTRLIDTYIAKKQQQVERWQAYRAALINQAVTKGLNPAAPMKASGIEWLGEIPAHWKVKKLKWVVKEKLQYGANEATELDDQTLPRYIRITDFGEDGKLKQDTFRSLPYDKAKEYLLNDGDILFARSGATVGKTFQFKNYDGIACFAGYLIKAISDEQQILSDFLYLFTKSNSYENWKNSVFIQATIQNIGADKYSLLPIPIPSLSEQRAIAAYLDEQTAKIDTLAAAAQRQLERLHAYRTALISDVVTGKLDVRGELMT